MKFFVLTISLLCCAPFVVLVQSADAQCARCGVVVNSGCLGCASQAGYYPFHGNAAYRPDIVAHPTCDGSPLLLRRCTGFHGKYYGRPYNYRNLLDYPWHEPLRASKFANTAQPRIKTIPTEPARDETPGLHPTPTTAPTAELFDTSWVQSTDDKPALRFRTTATKKR